MGGGGGGSAGSGASPSTLPQAQGWSLTATQAGCRAASSVVAMYAAGEAPAGAWLAGHSPAVVLGHTPVSWNATRERLMTPCTTVVSAAHGSRPAVLCKEEGRLGDGGLLAQQSQQRGQRLCMSFAYLYPASAAELYAHRIHNTGMQGVTCTGPLMLPDCREQSQERPCTYGASVRVSTSTTPHCTPQASILPLLTPGLTAAASSVEQAEQRSKGELTPLALAGSTYRTFATLRLKAPLVSASTLTRTA